MNILFPVPIIIGDIKWLWHDHPDRRWSLLLVTLPCLIGSVLLVAYLDLLELLGYKWVNPFYKEKK